MKCNKNFMGRRFIRFILVNVMIFFSYFNANAQEMPPRPSSVFLVQNMSFGAFTLTGPGHVYISPNGTRTWTDKFSWLTWVFYGIRQFWTERQSRYDHAPSDYRGGSCFKRL